MPRITVTLGMVEHLTSTRWGDWLKPSDF